MKRITLIILLFSTWMNAQKKYDHYDKLWQEVKQLEKDNLPKSANEKVAVIFQKAKKANNSPQVIKALMHQSKYALIVEEEAQLKIMHNFESEIKQADFPTKNILESIIAGLYWQYFKQNRWQFYNRTNTSEKVDEKDFRTWDLHTIFNEIHTHYQNSLQNGLLAQQKPLDDFDVLLHTQKGSKKYRPTLYDFLAHNALDFYKTGESNLAQPSYKFEIENPDLLGDNPAFLSVDLTSKDTLSQKRLALEIFKNLTLFHHRNKHTDALVDLTLNRLDFVKSNARFSEVDAVYLETLKKLKEAYKTNPISTEIDYRIALEYQRLGQNYTPLTQTENQFLNKKALEVCELAIEKFPESNGANKCLNLKNTIQQPTLQILNEKMITPNQVSKVLVSYKNMNKLFFRVLKAAPNTEERIQKIYNQKKKLTYLNKFQIATRFESNLTNEFDYQNHKTEIIIPALKQGHYIILASENKDFNDENSYAFSFVQATHIVLIESNLNRTYRYQVVNRETGEPLANANVNLRNKNTRYTNVPIDKTLISDKNGFVSYTPTASHNRVEITVTHKDDKGLFRYFRLYEPNRSDRSRPFHNNSIFLFTDRSIYRPAQIVYFKGIAVSQYENKSHVIANQSIEVTLTDVNYQKVQSLKVETNEFGSFSGEFILPNTGLTGHFEITAKGETSFVQKINPFSNNTNIYGSTGFSVEEYKRPKFSAEFNKIKESIKLNDSVKVKGVATAYAGSSISDAKVVYRVKREVQYPRWWYWYRPYFSSEAQEITHGETTTNDKGEFEISFLAQPDKSVNKKDLPVFNYKITADITDINGETRSASTVVNVGYHTLNIEVNAENKLDKDDKNNILKIDSKNLNGEFVATKGRLAVFKIPTDNTVNRERPWASPDYQNIPKAEFSKLFPHEIYDSQSYEKTIFGNKNLSELQISPIFQKTFDTEKEKEINLGKIKKWESGKYMVIIEAKDAFNQFCTDKTSFELFSKKDNKVSDKQLFSIQLNKKEYQPNEQVKLRVGSASENVTVVIDIEKDHKVIRTDLIHLSDEIKTLNIPVYEKDLGGFAINYHFVNYNSFKTGSLSIAVPYPKTELEIETLSFRDKLQPGQEETWQFKIKGNQSEKLAAEILTSMYDASLDQFVRHHWNFKPIYHRYYHTASNSRAYNSFGTENFRTHLKPFNYINIRNQSYDALNWFGFSLNNHTRFGRGRYMEVSAVYGEGTPGVMMKKTARPVSAKAEMVIEEAEVIADEDSNLAEYKDQSDSENGGNNNEETPTTDFSNVKIRTNFKETAFFFPHLKTDSEGNISFEFTTPESLTQWKLQVLAHTKDLHTAVKSFEAVTQKELMLLPNPPRFLRQGDQIVFSTKIANISDKALNGEVVLQLFDALTNKAIDIDLGNTNATQSFEVSAKGNTSVSWNLSIPENIQAVLYKIIAKAGDYSDGEQNVLPVLTNRMLVTETLPMWVRSHQTKTFSLDKLKNNTSSTLKNHKLTLEVTSNPAWYAVQALPYLMEYPHECAEQTFSRYYANTLASHIANSNPAIQHVFNQWKNSAALLSNLEKNQELKSLIIQETPWLRDAQSETEQKKRIALLFDLHKMKTEQEKAVRKLEQLQMNNGGFPWFKGSRYANRYISQHIVGGFGHLKKLGVGNNEGEKMLTKALTYLDNEIRKDYEKLLKRARIIKERAKTEKKGERLAKEFLAKNNTSHFQVHYLYVRSFFKENKIPKSLEKAVHYYTEQSYEYWKDYNLYSKGLISLVAYRNDNNSVANKILKSLKENSVSNEELGMYWKANTSSWYWYQAPIETQALLIEAFSEIEKDVETIDNLKIWLLKNKQTNRWKTTKATTEAVYALLLQGTDWLETTEFVNIKIGDTTIDPLALEDTKVEAGTGYYKTAWNGNEITPKMADVVISKESDGIAWGALYWQYFEDLDKITHAKTPLQLSKKLFLKTDEARGEQLTEITEKTALQLGDLIRVRIELKVDRAMEFIHMKDMRASGLEPINVISRYKWQDGLGYYESTKDAATHFFIDYLPKGVYVFEYDLRVNNAGDFSNGITTIQSMYAPEFSSHSEGIRVKAHPQPFPKGSE